MWQCRNVGGSSENGNQGLEGLGRCLCAEAVVFNAQILSHDQLHAHWIKCPTESAVRKCPKGSYLPRKWPELFYRRSGIPPKPDLLGVLAVMWDVNKKRHVGVADGQASAGYTWTSLRWIEMYDFLMIIIFSSSIKSKMQPSYLKHHRYHVAFNKKHISWNSQCVIPPKTFYSFSP